MNRGCGPTVIVSVARFVFASTRVTTLFSGLLTHTAPSAYTQATDPGATATSATALFDSGSMRDSTPFGSLTIQIASGPAASPPSLFAGPTGIVAVTLLVFISTRTRPGFTPFSTVGRSPQIGTQILPNP